jgi:hypothetical protein
MSAEHDIERIVRVGEPFQDIAFVKDNGAWSLFGNASLIGRFLGSA